MELVKDFGVNRYFLMFLFFRIWWGFGTFCFFDVYLLRYFIYAIPRHSNYRCFLEGFKHIKTNRKHLLEGAGRATKGLFFEGF